MQSHEYYNVDRTGASDGLDDNLDQVELHDLNDRSSSYQRQRPQAFPQNAPDQQEYRYPQHDHGSSTPYLSPYPDRQYLSRHLVSARQTPLYQSAHTSSTTLNSEETPATSTWTLNMQGRNTGFLTESHNAYDFQSDFSSPRNSGCPSTYDLAYLKRHRHMASMTDSRPVTPSRVSIVAFVICLLCYYELLGYSCSHRLGTEPGHAH